jgi:hypothetical protein
MTIGAFMAVTLLPFYRMTTTPIEEISATENRLLATEPSLSHASSFASFTDDLEAFLVDHFGFREDLIYLNTLVRAEYLKQSATDRVVIGKDGWLYLNTHGLLDDYRGVIDLSSSELARWKTYFEERDRWLNARGIEYLVVLAPDKHTIYPEYLPDGYDVAKPDHTRFDQLMAYLNASDAAGNILDLRPQLLQAKQDQLIYRQYDAHWNQIGAFVAYQAIMQRIRELFPDAYIIEQNTLHMGTLNNLWSGDLSRMMNLDDIYVEELPRWSVPSNQRCAEPISEATRGTADIHMRCPQRPLRVLIFRDSFSAAMIRYLEESFGESYYVWATFSLDDYAELVETFQPDIVIEQIVERFLHDVEAREQGIQ